MSASAPYKILLTYSWTNGNIGDMAITPGMIEALDKHFLPYEATIVSIFKENSKGYIQSINYLKQYVHGSQIYGNPFPQSVSENELVLGSLDSIQKMHGKYLRNLWKISPSVTQKFLDADLLLYNAGMVLTYNNWGVEGRAKMLLANWLPLIAATSVELPAALWGQSLGPMDTTGIELAKRFLPKTMFLSTRESMSLEYIMSIGITHPAPNFVPDSTLYFSTRDESWAREFMFRNNLKEGEFITLIIRTDGWWGRPLEEIRREKHLEHLAKLIDTWIENTGQSVLLAPECEREIPIARDHLYTILSESSKSHCILMDHFWTPEQAKAVYNYTHILISMELHSILLTLPLGIPVLHLYYEEMGYKTWFMKDAGLQSYMLDIDKVSSDDIMAKLNYIHTHHTEVASQVKRGANYCIKKGDEGMARLKAMVDKNQN